VWRSLVARFVRDEEVVGSNPATPTNNTADQGRFPVREIRPFFVASTLLGESWETIFAGPRASAHLLVRGERAFDRTATGDEESGQRLLNDILDAIRGGRAECDLEPSPT
jgi:hypothetical protein